MLGARYSFEVAREDNQHLYLLRFTSSNKRVEHVKAGKTNDIARRVAGIKSKLNTVGKHKDWTITGQRLDFKVHGLA